MRHLQTAVGTLGRLAQQPFANFLTVLVIGIAIALPASLQVMVANARLMGGGWEHAVSMTVYLKPAVTVDKAEQLANRLQKRHDIAQVRLVKADDALKEFRRLSGFGQALDALAENPLPHALILEPAIEATSPASIEELQAELTKLPDVDGVKLDTAWVKRLYTILDAIRRAVVVMGVLLAAGVTLVIGNTIRLDIQNRREEIEVTKLVGGSNAFVRRPFLYTGFWYGLGGGLIAALLVALGVAAMGEPVRRIAGLYGSSFELQGLGLANSLGLLGLGIALGWGGSFIATGLHLRNIEPR
jgi:cell division transport system permease protein